MQDKLLPSLALYAHAHISCARRTAGGKLDLGSVVMPRGETPIEQRLVRQAVLCPIQTYLKFPQTDDRAAFKPMADKVMKSADASLGW